MVTGAFFDTTVLLAGMIEFEADAPAQRIFNAIASRRIGAPMTAWHCCLECYAVATRLPPAFRLSPVDAARLIDAEILGRFAIHALPKNAAAGFLRTSGQDRVAGGRIYDAHIADVARSAKARLVITDNRRHFTALLRDDVRVLTSAEFDEEFL